MFCNCLFSSRFRSRPHPPQGHLPFLCTKLGPCLGPGPRYFSGSVAAVRTGSRVVHGWKTRAEHLETRKERPGDQTLWQTHITSTQTGPGFCSIWMWESECLLAISRCGLCKSFPLFGQLSFLCPSSISFLRHPFLPAVSKLSGQQ